MSFINGTDTEIFSGRLQGQRCFVCAESKERVQQIAQANGIPAEKVSRMLAQACDDDAYHNDLWRTVVGGLAFTFHISRFKIELRRAQLV